MNIKQALINFVKHRMDGVRKRTYEMQIHYNVYASEKTHYCESYVFY